MHITVNDQKLALEFPLNLQELLSRLSQSERGVALAVNSQIVSRSLWASHQLQDGDRITLIKATAGG